MAHACGYVTRAHSDTYIIVHTHSHTLVHAVIMVATNNFIGRERKCLDTIVDHHASTVFVEAIVVAIMINVRVSPFPCFPLLPQNRWKQAKVQDEWKTSHVRHFCLSLYIFMLHVSLYTHMSLNDMILWF